MTSKSQDRRYRNLISRIRLRAATATLVLAVLLVAGAIATPSTQAQTFTTLHSFDRTDGNPIFTYAPLFQATNGHLYGTTWTGGANGAGTVFEITPSGTLTTLYNFCSQSGCTDGEAPGWLIQATDGNFYGTATSGGANGYGTVFKVTPGGALTTLHSFVSTDGDFPVWLVQATDGNLYGTAFAGGANSGGTVFRMTPGGTLTTLYDFCSQSSCTDGQSPNGVIQATDGDFYGTTYAGGVNNTCPNFGVGCGTVFKITPGGTLTTLHSFAGYPTDGSEPYVGVPPVQGIDGNLYGTTLAGGANGAGTVFKITPTGTFTTLYDFCSQSGCTDGQIAQSGLVQAADGNFYGTTLEGGTISPACFAVGGDFGCGTVFKITPSGTLTTVYSLCLQSGCTDGEGPQVAPAQDTNGTFYGITGYGGTSSACAPEQGCGTVFSLSVGLRPFVETQTTSGKVGSLVKILGTNLTGTTSVTFNGTSAVFKVVLPSAISATVPAGATSGRVEVTIPGGTLTSNLPFRVRP